MRGQVHTFADFLKRLSPWAVEMPDGVWIYFPTEDEARAGGKQLGAVALLAKSDSPYDWHLIEEFAVPDSE